MSKPGSFLLPGAKKHYAPDLVLEPEHIDVAVEVDFPKRKCHCEVTTTFRANKHPRKQLVELNAIGFLNIMISSVTEHDVNFRYDGEILYLHWEKPFLPNEERIVRISYTVVEPIDGLFFSMPDEGYPARPTYLIADHETERARYWLPCVDYPAVRTTFAFQFTFDQRFSCVANGKMVEEVVSNGMKTSRWRLDYPCPSYLCAFAIGEIELVSDGEVDGMPIAYLGVKGVPKELLLDCFRETPNMVRWLSKRINSPFPFRGIKYYQLAVPVMSGAMECISLVTWHDGYLFDKKLGEERRLLLDLINIHEMAHSYFGDALVIRHFEHAWLKESWATYIEAVWVEEHLGEDHFRYEMEVQSDLYINETAKSYVRPIVTREYNSSWNMFDEHLYPGGSWRLHMLRKILGDDVFWAAVSDYVNQFSNDLVETTDFRRCLEETSGRNLHKFFDQWIYGQGFPQLKGEYWFDLETKEVKIVLEQVQPPEWTIFDLELEIEITCDDDSIHLAKLDFDGQKRSSTIIFLEKDGSKPTQIRVDPSNCYLFSLEMNPGEDILGATVANAKDIVTRIWAGCELIRIGSQSSFLKLEEAILNEKFYGVRVKIAKKLGQTKSVLACRLLAKLLLRERDPMALRDIASACQFKDKQIREAILQVLQTRKENLPYIAHGNLLHALGRQGDAQDLEFLLQAAKSDYAGFNGHVRAGAFKGLSEIKRVEAYEYLKTRVSYGVEREDVRPTLTAVFGRCASMLDRMIQIECADILSDLLRDPDWRVRKAAVEGLVTLEAKDKIRDITDMFSCLAKQNHPWLERKLSALKSSGDESNSMRFRSEIDNLEAKIKLLQERVRILENK